MPKIVKIHTESVHRDMTRTMVIQRLYWIVANFSYHRMTSASLSNAVWVLWYFLKPIWNGSRIFAMARKSISWSYANFSRNFERKYNRAIGQKSDKDEGSGFFLSAMIRDLLQTGGKTPWASEVLNNLVRKGAITGNALAATRSQIILCRGIFRRIFLWIFHRTIFWTIKLV